MADGEPTKGGETELTIREPAKAAHVSAAAADASTAKVAPAPADSSDHLSSSKGVAWYKAYFLNMGKPIEVASRKMTAADYPKARFLAPLAAWLDNFFLITHRKSDFWTEFQGGMTTFFAMAYIMVLNGVIIQSTGISKESSFFSTALSAGIFTLLMGVMVGVPIALAPGMGLNGYFAATCSMYGGVLTWQQGLAAVFLSGIIYLFLTFTGLRLALFKAVPKSLRAAITVGIGFFLTIIGLKIGEIMRMNFSNPFGPAWADFQSGISPPHDLMYFEWELYVADFNKYPAARVAAIGIMWMSFLLVLKWPGAVITAIVLTTFCGINYPNADTPFQVTNLADWRRPGGPDFVVKTDNLAGGHFDFSAANTAKFWEVVFTFLFVELFDSFGTITATVERAGLFTNEKAGEEIVNRAMGVDGFGLSLGAIIGSNSITCYIESNTGIEAGARTGFASFVTGAAFLLCLLFLQPFVGIIPDAATMPALVVVGALSLPDVKHIDFNDVAISWPAFLGIAMMGFTYSIANGICAMFIFYSFMQIVRWGYQGLVLRARARFSWFPLKPLEEGTNLNFPHPLMIIMSVFMVIRFAYLGA